MSIKSKLTSRKFWAAIASFAALLVVALGGAQEQATQITAIIMAGATVVAYIVGEGLVDAASAGATTVINGSPTITAGQAATMPDPTPVIGTVDPAPAEGTPTGTAQAAEVKQDTALPEEAQTSATVPTEFKMADEARAAFPGIVETGIKLINIAIGQATDPALQAQLKSTLAAFETLRAAKVAASGSSPDGV